MKWYNIIMKDRKYININVINDNINEEKQY